MAYNASLGKDASVLTFAVSAVRINGHPSALDPPFVDFGRQLGACSLHGPSLLSCVFICTFLCTFLCCDPSSGVVPNRC